MSTPTWTPAVGDLVIVGPPLAGGNYEVTRVDVDAPGLPVVWLRSRGPWQQETQAVWSRGRWIVNGVGELRPLT